MFRKILNNSLIALWAANSAFLMAQDRWFLAGIFGLLTILEIVLSAAYKD